VIVVGESGAGKSSLFNVLLGFAAPDAGRVLLGGTPLDTVDPVRWRRQVAWIGQSPELVYGTIADNIRLGRPDASEEDIASAAVQAGAEAFIQSLPLGMETPIGEQGAGLSRGQAQRVALARAILRDAPVLLLDEPLASLDGETQRHVSAAIDALAPHRTLVVLSHHPTALQGAHRVVVMDHGRVAFHGGVDDYREYARRGRRQQGAL